MKYFSQFKDVNDQLYTVNIITDGDGSTTKEFTLGGSPFTTEMDNSDKIIYKPCKYQSATIEMVSQDYNFDIYSSTAQGTKVQLLKDSEIVWTGFITPNLYDQGFNEFRETISLEAIDGLSTLQYYKYTPVGKSKDIVSFISIINHLISQCHSYNYFYISDNIQKDDTTNSSINESLYISEQNFFDEKKENETDNDVAWTMQEVLEEICQYLGYTCIAEGDSVYFLDYDAIREGENDYYKYTVDNIANPTKETKVCHKMINENDHSENGASLSLDKTYNKVKVKDNLYDFNLAIPDPFDDTDNITSYNENYEDEWETGYTSMEKLYHYNPTTKFIEFWGAAYSPEKSPHQRDAYVVVQYKKNPKFKCYKYNDKLEDVTASYEGGLNYKDTQNFSGATLASMWVNHLTLDDDTEIKAKTDLNSPLLVTTTWADIKAGNKYTSLECIANALHLIQPSYSDYIILCSQSDENTTTYINNKNYLNYPYFETTEYIDTNNLYGSPNASLLLSGSYCFSGIPRNRKCMFPLDNMDVDPKDGKRSIKDLFIPAKLQIGNLYWNGTDWTKSEAFFNIEVEPANGNSNRLDNYMDRFLNFRNTVSWGSNITHKGTLIKLPEVLLRGEPKLTIYKPYGFNIGYKDDMYKPYFAVIKDLKLEVVVDVADADSDTEYTNVIDTNYASELDKIEFKINTYTGKKPTYSAVAYKKGDDYVYLDTVYNKALWEHQVGTERADGTNSQYGELNPEEQLIWKISHQYEEPSVKLDFNLRNDIKVYGLYSNTTLRTKTLKDGTLRGRYYIVDKIDTDYKQAQSAVTLIEKFGYTDYDFNKGFTYNLDFNLEG